jgi:hypothetical protein
MMLVLAEVIPPAVNAVVESSTNTSDWKSAAILMGGAILMRFATWLASWINGKGAEIVHEKLSAISAQMNQNSLLGQIKADDAIIAILERAIPTVLASIPTELAEALKDGKVTAAEFQSIAAHLWAEASPQIVGGANDYLKESSFSDGKVVAEMVFKRFFAKQTAQARGFTVK